MFCVEQDSLTQEWCLFDSPLKKIVVARSPMALPQSVNIEWASSPEGFSVVICSRCNCSHATSMDGQGDSGFPARFICDSCKAKLTGEAS